MAGNSHICWDSLTVEHQFPKLKASDQHRFSAPICRYRLMVDHLISNQIARVRFSLSAPSKANIMITYLYVWLCCDRAKRPLKESIQQASQWDSSCVVIFDMKCCRYIGKCICNIRECSSVGQSDRLISDRSKVQPLLFPPASYDAPPFFMESDCQCMGRCAGKHLELQLSWLERQTHNLWVVGSMPTSSTIGF